MSDEFVNETWTFKGYTVSRGKLAAVWLDENGEGLVYGKTRDAEGSIGGRYSIEVCRDGDSIRARFRAKSYLGPVDDADRVAEWRLDSRAAEAEHDSLRLEEKLRKEHGDIGAMTLSDIKTMLSKRRGYKNRQALIAAVLDYIDG